jgi:hypothetical protein
VGAARRRPRRGHRRRPGLRPRGERGRRSGDSGPARVHSRRSASGGALPRSRRHSGARRPRRRRHRELSQGAGGGAGDGIESRITHLDRPSERPAGPAS